jgi:hypothetical protein
MVRAATGNDGPEARPVTEDAEMGELMDDDRFERFRWRQDEPPGEAQPTLTRCTSPAAALVADRHGGRGNVERCSVTGDLSLHEDTGTVAEPGLEDGGNGPAIRARQPDNELVAILGALAGDAGSARPRGRVEHTESVELAAIADRGPVAQPAACRELRAVARLTGEVTANPRLSLAEEPFDIGFGMSPAAARRRWEGHDEPVGRMDRQPQPARADRAAEDVRRQWGRLPPLERVGRHRCRWCHIAVHRRRLIGRPVWAATKPWVVELQLTATNAAGDSFTAPFYAYVHVH